MNLLNTIDSNSQLELVKDIAYRLRDPDSVRSIVLNQDNHPPHAVNKNTAWGGISLEGYAGPLILFAELDRLFPNEKWEEIVHRYVLKIKTTIEKEGIHFIPPSLFGGLAGTCLALHQASKNGSRYQRMIDVLVLHPFCSDKQNLVYYHL